MSRPVCDKCQAGEHNHPDGERCMHLVLGDIRVAVCSCKTN